MGKIRDLIGMIKVYISSVFKKEYYDEYYGRLEYRGGYFSYKAYVHENPYRVEVAALYLYVNDDTRPRVKWKNNHLVFRNTSSKIFGTEVCPTKPVYGSVWEELYRKSMDDMNEKKRSGMYTPKAKMPRKKWPKL